MSSSANIHGNDFVRFQEFGASNIQGGCLPNQVPIYLKRHVRLISQSFFILSPYLRASLTGLHYRFYEPAKPPAENGSPAS